MHDTTELLENEHLRVTLLPEEGGRIGSIRSKRSGTEFLVQAQPHRQPIHPGWNAAFQDGPCAGIEECLPSVGACDRNAQGGAVPDHGDLWQLRWKVEDSPDPLSRCITATTFSRPLQVRKQISLRRHSLQLEYSVRNIGTEPTSFLYACHPLLAVDAGDRIVLADEVKALRTHSSRRGRLGPDGGLISWPRPHSQPSLELDLVLADDTGVADMLYTGRLSQGRCSLYRSATQEGITLHFDTAQLPYLGLWLCYGGWPEERGMPRQYAVALEPTTAPFGTLQDAHEHAAATWLAAGSSITWGIRFEVSEPGVDLHHLQR